MSLIIGALFVKTSVLVFIFVMILFSSSFALMYAPMIDTLTRTIPKEKTGTAIGFYNFCLNIATSIGITYVAIFMETKYLGKNFTGLFSDLVAIQYSNVLLVLAVKMCIRDRGLIGIYIFGRRSASSRLKDLIVKLIHSQKNLLVLLSTNDKEINNKKIKRCV